MLIAFREDPHPAETYKLLRDMGLYPKIYQES